jgi:hypothetical protein
MIARSDRYVIVGLVSLLLFDPVVMIALRVGGVV